MFAAAHGALIVFAAASLHAAFTDLGARFEHSHPGIAVRFDFDGSQVLETQLAEGARADLFASADRRWMDKAKRDGLVQSDVIFAGNRLAALAGPSSPVRSLQDLVRPGVRLDLCADSVPCGKYTRDALRSLGLEPGAERNVVSNELNVEGVVTKVVLGEADAGIAYATDAKLNAGKVRVIAIPARAQPHIAYPIAVVTGAQQPALAAEFIRYVRSGPGRRILLQYGFSAAP
jgi:molybdate transport system substrate-binding protein